MADTIQFKRGTAERWAEVNPVLAIGEAGLDTTNFIFKIGNGSSTWSELPDINIKPDELADILLAVQTVRAEAEEAVAQTDSSKNAAAASASAADVSRVDAEAARASSQSYAESADASQEWAEAARAGASQARSLAETARAGAQTAQGLAETARTGAQTAQTAAADSATSASSSATEASGSATAAQDARTGAETARSGSEAAQTGAQASRTAAEAAAELSLAGQFVGTTISSAGVDINTLLTPGRYRFSSAAGTASSAMPPGHTAGILDVLNTVPGGAAMQIFYPYGNNAPASGIFMRRAPNTFGSPHGWRFIPSTVFNNPTDQPGVSISLTDPTSSVERQVLPTGSALGIFSLDAVFLPGHYYQSSSTNGTIARGYPYEGFYGVVEVVGTGGSISRQVATGFNNTNGSRMFQRNRNTSNTAWGAWQFMPHQRVTSPVGEPGITVETWDEQNNRYQGVMPIGTALGLNDLNSITQAGRYYQNTASSATTGRNYPRTGACSLDVSLAQPGTGRIIQELTYHADTVSGTPGIYQRTSRSNNQWTPWRFIAPQRINSPVEQPGLEIFTWDDVNNREQSVMPGPIVLGSANLNDITLTGKYIQPVGGSALPERNYPALVRGVLDVTTVNASPLYLVQRFTPQSGTTLGVTGEWVRRCNDLASQAPWSPWRFVPTQRVDTTAGRAIYTYDDINGREQRIYGDTGFRGISSLLQNGWVLGSAGGLFIRRTDDLVTLIGYNLDGTAATSGGFLLTADLPGFLPVSGGHRFLVSRDNGTNVAVIGVSNQTTGNVSTPTGFVVGSVAYWSISWQTAQAWPTALPGVASGTIPNL